MSLCEVPIIVSDLNRNLSGSKKFRKILQCEVTYVTVCSAVLCYTCTGERNRLNRPPGTTWIIKCKIASVKVNFRRRRHFWASPMWISTDWFNSAVVSAVYSGYNIAIKLGRLIKVCVHEACSEVRTSKLLSRIFPVEKGAIAFICAL
jgi:hypothetical protein